MSDSPAFLSRDSPLPVCGAANARAIADLVKNVRHVWQAAATNDLVVPMGYKVGERRRHNPYSFAGPVVRDCRQPCAVHPEQLAGFEGCIQFDDAMECVFPEPADMPFAGMGPVEKIAIGRLPVGATKAHVVGVLRRLYPALRIEAVWSVPHKGKPNMASGMWFVLVGRECSDQLLSFNGRVLWQVDRVSVFSASAIAELALWCVARDDHFINLAKPLLGERTMKKGLGAMTVERARTGR